MLYPSRVVIPLVGERLPPRVLRPSRIIKHQRLLIAYISKIAHLHHVRVAVTVVTLLVMSGEESRAEGDKGEDAPPDNVARDFAHDDTFAFSKLLNASTMPAL